jgi:hypothetical protein
MAVKKAAVSVTEMAAMLDLSRARFYQLMQAGILPAPARDADTGRPFYSEELQRVCLEVRRRNVGANGKPVVFYARRKVVQRIRVGRHDGFIDALESLGLASVTESQVSTALAELFPAGTADLTEAEVIRAVFLRVRQNTGRDPG